MNHTGRDFTHSCACPKRPLSQAGPFGKSVLHCRRLKPAAVDAPGGANVQSVQTALTSDKPKLSYGAQQHDGTQRPEYHKKAMPPRGALLQTGACQDESHVDLA